MDEIVTLISSVGFPIAAYIALFWYVYQKDTQHKEEISLLTQAIQNNTLVMTELRDKLNLEEKKDV